MSIQKDHFLEDYFMSSCHVGKTGEYLFIAQQRVEDGDPFAMKELRGIFYRHGKWESKPICYNIELYGGYTTKPSAAWVVVNFFGKVARFDNNGGKWEDDIPPHPDFENIIISNIKSIEGRLYTISSDRLIRRRDGINQWTLLDNGIPDPTKIVRADRVHLKVIDGFSESDIYAGGHSGEVWHWDGKIWRQIDIPTNADIEDLVCGGDGLVYLSTDKSTFWIGRNNQWKEIKYKEYTRFRNLTWFKDRIYMAYANTLYEIKDGKFQESELNSHKDKPADCSFIDANDEVMLIGSKLEIATFDGKKFTTIMPFKIGGS